MSSAGWLRRCSCSSAAGIENSSTLGTVCRLAAAMFVLFRSRHCRFVNAGNCPQAGCGDVGALLQQALQIGCRWELLLTLGTVRVSLHSYV